MPGPVTCAPQLLLPPLLLPALAAAPRTTCGRNNGGCLPGTRCVVRGGRVDCDFSHTCPALAAPPHGFVDCPGLSGVPPSYSLRLVEGDMARSTERRSACTVGCEAGFSATGFTGTRYCTASGWSDTTAVRCASSRPCAGNKCQHGGTCAATVNGGYRCRCVAGFAGPNCAQQDSCVQTGGQPIAGGATLCQHGGHCRNIVGGSYACVCRPGFAGLHCAYENPCAQNPCRNRGRCVAGSQPAPGSPVLPHHCRCANGWGGPDCATKLRPAACPPNHCLNHGKCIVLFNATLCTCAPGFGGERCELHDTKNDCAPRPCKNGGVCHDLHRRFECKCPPNFRGPTCAERDEVDDCADCAAAGHGDRCLPAPCLNGGVCQDKFHDFACSCNSGWGGERCELAASARDACGSHPCQHGGRCTNTFDGYRCRCAKGFAGEQCEATDATDDCAGGACCNGECRDQGATFECSCLPGWFGVDCSGRTPGNFRPSRCAGRDAAAGSSSTSAAAGPGGTGLGGWALALLGCGCGACGCARLARRKPKEPLPPSYGYESEAAPLLDAAQ